MFLIIMSCHVSPKIKSMHAIGMLQAELAHNIVARHCGVHHNKGNNNIIELRTTIQRESQNSYVYKQKKSVNNRKSVKTVMTLTWYRHF
jgi:hypothetical protein